MAEVEVGRGQRSWAVWGGAALGVLLVVVGYVWLSDAHSDELRLVHDGNVVRVQRGYFAPVGWTDYRPTEAFRPVTVDADVPVREGPCADLADCESRLFDVVAAQARRYLRRRESLREAGELIAQAVKLSGAQNREVMLELQGDEQYVKGELKLESVVEILKESQDHFYRARAMDARTFKDAESRLKLVNGLLRQLQQARVGRPGDAEPIPVPFDPEPVEPAPSRPPAARPDVQAPPEPPPAGEPDAGGASPEVGPDGGLEL